MKINITAGDCLNNILINKYYSLNETFVPFREAMIKGTYSSRLFSNEFIIERSLVHNVSVNEYKEKINAFLNIINNITQYNEIILWFGNDEFCIENLKIILQTLSINNYKGKLILNTVIEETGEIIDYKILQ